ncbi:MAG: LL-diaminopimelate aminotransferase [Alkalispirochaetaceae bacterium]
MVNINPHFEKLQNSYLFIDIARRVEAFAVANPGREIIKLGIGDVTRPLTPAVLSAMHEAVDEMGKAETFRGYGPEQGYGFLREAIAKADFQERGVDIDADEIIVSDGAKCDTGNFQELFSVDSVVAVADPVYPVYVDTNVMAGRTGTAREGRYDGLVYLEGNEENGFVPPPPAEHADILYLCFPNNPTGAVATKEQLAAYVEYAYREKAIILFDAAYEAFIRDDSVPKSIFEIEGARECAVEFRSLSKTAGFTGTRCAFTVIPEECRAFDREGTERSVRELWLRRHTTKFNGVSYPVQRGAAAIYSAQGRRESRELTDYYLRNARQIRSTMEGLGYNCYGGVNSPYVWVAAAGSSWDLFDKLLNEAAVVTTPGVGFGKAGEGFIRISGFNDREKVEEALRRIERAVS